MRTRTKPCGKITLEPWVVHRRVYRYGSKKHPEYLIKEISNGVASVYVSNTR